MSLRFWALGLVTVCAGCQTGGTTSGFGCPAVAGVIDSGAKLVSPPAGATGVSTAIGAISFTVTIASLRQGTVTLQSASAPVAGGPVSTDANGVSSAAVPPLQAHTVYVAFVGANPVDPTSGCRGSVSANLGSFTTQ